MMKNYREASLEGASGVDLVVALYDGLIRFLVQANDACVQKDVTARRIAARRALEIIIHLQLQLRTDVGGRPAERLQEFYASITASILRASAAGSGAQFLRAAECVREVRSAWQQVALKHRPVPRDLQTVAERLNTQPRSSQAVLVPASTATGAKEGAKWFA